MTGVFTDNQPDFTYILPGETKVFSMVWYPVTEIGAAVNATRDAAMSMSMEDGAVTVSYTHLDGPAAGRFRTDRNPRGGPCPERRSGESNTAPRPFAWRAVPVRPEAAACPAHVQPRWLPSSGARRAI